MSLSAYLPPHLIESLAKRKRPPESTLVEIFPAALLPADVSGFAALTKKLQKRRGEGEDDGQA